MNISRIAIYNRFFSLPIWKRRFLKYRLKLEDAVNSFLMRNNEEYRVGIVGDFEHFIGSKLYKARYFRLIKGKKIVFEPYRDGAFYEKIIKWEPFKRVSNPKTDVSIVNASMGAINKASLDVLQQKVFGTSLIVDPLTFEGSFLEKDGGMPDGAGHSANHTPFIIHHTPISQLNDLSVYVQLIDNEDDQGHFVDYRIYVLNGQIYPDCCRFALKAQFETQSAGSFSKAILPLEQEFKPDEIENMKSFVESLQLDYAEVDVLRDNGSRNIYLVDVNNTPYGDFRKVGFQRSLIKSMYRSVFLNDH